MPAFCTIADVKTFIGLTGSADDALLTSLVSATSAALETIMNRTVNQTTYTDVQDGNGRAQLLLVNRPVILVSGVLIDGVAVPQAVGFGAGWGLDGNVVYLRNRVFARGLRNVSVTYSAGWAVVPDDIKQATIETAALKYKQKEQSGYTSKSLAGESVAFDKSDFPESVERVMNNYRKVVPW